MARQILLFAIACQVGCSEVAPSSEASFTNEGRPASKVELKLTVAADQIALARERLALDPEAAERRDVTFFDTPSLELYAQGILLRVRDVDGGPGDSTAKIRPLDRNEVGKSWFSEDGFKCELDRTPDKVVSSCSLKARQKGSDIRDAVAGQLAVKKLFTDEQEDFLDEEGGDIAWDSLVPLGPIASTVWTVDLEGLPDAVDAELWALPDGRELLELSVKVKAADAEATAAALEDAVSELELDTASTQETKTKTALDFFAAQLDAAEAP